MKKTGLTVRRYRSGTGIDSGPVQPNLLDELRRAHRRGARLVSLCEGAFILAQAGLLDGRTVTTHWASADELGRLHPEVTVNPDVLYIDDGDVLTSAGAAAAMDLCLHVVRCDYGAEIANLVARRPVVPPHRDGGQAQFIQEPIPAYAPNDPFGDALTWAQEHLGETLAIEIVAAKAAMSPRSFARRFRTAMGTTPHLWLSHQRVVLAQRLLESTDMSIDDVARNSGLGTSTNLRGQFARVLRVSPTAYRRSFQTQTKPEQ